ncbi:hypothetical protein NDU88_004959 [Pleurodeles waltl]|uniref:Uncharacterized protein n=1 Tax=Pleurodeles waltl TaxID=8319 RepID=A0AAV7TSR2_PLEWA|nr:hypothetical protein NDU88_004959 [Pleurodeles waltl]
MGCSGSAAGAAGAAGQGNQCDVDGAISWPCMAHGSGIWLKYWLDMAPQRLVAQWEKMSGWGAGERKGAQRHSSFWGNNKEWSWGWRQLLLAMLGSQAGAKATVSGAAVDSGRAQCGLDAPSRREDRALCGQPGGIMGQGVHRQKKIRRGLAGAVGGKAVSNLLQAGIWLRQPASADHLGGSLAALKNSLDLIVFHTLMAQNQWQDQFGPGRAVYDGVGDNMVLDYEGEGLVEGELVENEVPVGTERRWWQPQSS